MQSRKIMLEVVKDILTDRLTCVVEPQRSVCSGIGWLLPACRYWGSCRGWRRSALVRCTSESKNKGLSNIFAPERLVVSICPNFTLRASTDKERWPWAKHEAWGFQDSPYRLQNAAYRTLSRPCTHCRVREVLYPQRGSVGNAVLEGLCSDKGLTIPNCDWPRIKVLEMNGKFVRMVTVVHADVKRASVLIKS
jgi:hypothetical protein